MAQARCPVPAPSTICLQRGQRVGLSEGHPGVSDEGGLLGPLQPGQSCVTMLIWWLVHQVLEPEDVLAVLLSLQTECTCQGPRPLPLLPALIQQASPEDSVSHCLPGKSFL